jgi:hypothetical protein
VQSDESDESEGGYARLQRRGPAAVFCWGRREAFQRGGAITRPISGMDRLHPSRVESMVDPFPPQPGRLEFGLSCARPRCERLTETLLLRYYIAVIMVQGLQAQQITALAPSSPLCNVNSQVTVETASPLLLSATCQPLSRHWGRLKTSALRTACMPVAADCLRSIHRRSAEAVQELPCLSGIRLSASLIRQFSP